MGLHVLRSSSIYLKVTRVTTFGAKCEVVIA